MKLVSLGRRGGAASPRVLLLTPPMTQLNTPYPATAYLTGFLAARGIPVEQADLSIEVALDLFSRTGLSRLFAGIRGRRPEVRRFLDRQGDYVATVDAVVRFLQGRDPTLATRIAGGLLPRGPREEANEVDLDWAFGALGVSERARYLATLYLYDLADLAHATVAPRFGLSRYAEALGTAAASFDPIAAALDEPPGLIDQILDERLAAHLERAGPQLVGITVPFPGNLYGALRIAQSVRRRLPSARVALGGGWVNTELRGLAEPRLFDLVDFVTLDDGERPLLCLLEHLAGARPVERLRRTFVRDRGEVRLCDGAEEADVAMAETAAPTYRGLPLDRYLSVIDLVNPMHRLWSDGRWSKLTVAHGCYWKRCTFCDVGLDYIGRYEPASARALADRIDHLIAETGESGFHFVDEAAPPLQLVELALELLARGRAISWWGNIRFEKTFTRDVCRLLAASGCIAVTGGLEVASDRLLALIEKGVTVAQVARVASAFAGAGVLVHAYLMYGFPTETAQETMDSLERVRQLFAAGAIHSAFWHRFTLTRHSPIAAHPERYGITVRDGAGRFANNDLAHDDPAGADHDRFAEGLRRAVFNFMHGVGLDRDARRWFDEEVPRARVAKDLVERALAERADTEPSRARLVWIGGSVRAVGGRRPGIAVAARSGDRFVALPRAREIVELLRAATPSGATLPRKGDAAMSTEVRRELSELGLLEVP